MGDREPRVPLSLAPVSRGAGRAAGTLRGHEQRGAGPGGTRGVPSPLPPGHSVPGPAAPHPARPQGGCYYVHV